MTFLRNYPLLLLVVALLFAGGHAYQVIGEFEAHHHENERDTVGGNAHGGAAHHEDREDEQKDAEHMLSDHVVFAVVPALMVPPIVAVSPAAPLDVRAGEMTDAPMAGIDHPPQLRG